MKKGIRTFLGLAVSASMIMSPVMEAMAANQFSVETEEVSGKVLFPGDSISGIEPVFLGPDGTQQEVTEGSWTNNTTQAYVMSGMSDGTEGLWLEPAGYVLTVKGGTSRGADASVTSNHFVQVNSEEESNSDDVAYYGAWTTVTVTADPAQDGQVFDHWQIDSENVTLADAAAAETTFEMAEGKVSLTAVYADAAPVTEAVTGAPVEEVVTEAPVVDTPAEEAPAEEAPVADVPAEEAPVVDAPAEETPVVDAPAEEAPAAEDGSGSGDQGVIVIGDGAEAAQDNGAEAPTEAQPQTFTLTVENGQGSGDYEVGTEVTITADELEGMQFTGWTTEAVTVWFTDSSSAQTTFSMPAEAVTVTANYTEIAQPQEAADAAAIEAGTEAAAEQAAQPETTQQPDAPVMPELYQVDVTNGEGTGTYEAGSSVNIIANDPEEGMQFIGWTISDNIVLDDAEAEDTSFVMPAQAVTVTANYATAEPETYPENDDVELIDGDETPEEETVAGLPEAAGETATEQVQPQAATETDAAGQPITEAVTETAATEPQVTETTATEAVETETEADTETETVEYLEETELETEADTEQAAAESYVVELANLDDITVNDAAYDENNAVIAEAGSKVSLTATEYDEKTFQKWTVTRTDTKEVLAVLEDSEDYLSATFTMPNSNVYVEAIYETLASNQVQVVNGSGSGTYTEGDYVDIEANAAPAGQRFKKWTVITGDITLDDETSAATGFTMPAEAVQVKAVYEIIPYTLTVNNGNGDGSYAKDTVVDLSADYPASGKEFASWVVTSNNASVSAADRYYASITMPAANVTLEATYKDGPSAEGNEIQGIAAGGEYLKGETITFTAVGNGMGNTNPNPGDYRFRPTGYQIGSVTGSWNNSPYTTSMAINAVGEYTLTVTYAKDVFDGNTWNPDGSSVSRSVKFYVVNALSVQTGDSSPILPLAVAAVAALAVIIILAVVMIKRRRRS